MIMSEAAQEHPEAAEIEAMVLLDDLVFDPVYMWRFTELEKRGFTRSQRACLSLIPDIVHKADALIAVGCPIETAFRLLS